MLLTQNYSAKILENLISLIKSIFDIVEAAVGTVALHTYVYMCILHRLVCFDKHCSYYRDHRCLHTYIYVCPTAIDISFRACQPAIEWNPQSYHGML